MIMNFDDYDKQILNDENLENQFEIIDVKMKCILFTCWTTD